MGIGTRWVLGTALAAVPAMAAAGEASWTDPASGREYVLLDGARTFGQASSECASRGLAVYDPRMVTAAEQQALLASPLLDSFEWESAARGARIAIVWNTSESVAVTWNEPSYGASVMLLARSANGSVATAFEGRGEDADGVQGICTSVAGFWYRCSLEYRCIYPDQAGIPQPSMRYHIAEYGATEAEAIRRIVETTQLPQWSTSEGQCALRPETQLCTRILP